MDMAQNKDKEEHLLCMIGIGSVKDSQTMVEYSKNRRTTTKDFGMIKTHGKYLGNTSQTNGKTNKNVESRMQAMRDSYYALREFGTRRDVKIKIKSTAFKGMVISAGLSGMEAETATPNEIQKIDTEILRLARKAMA